MFLSLCTYYSFCLDMLPSSICLKSSYDPSRSISNVASSGRTSLTCHFLLLQNLTTPGTTFHIYYCLLVYLHSLNCLRVLFLIYISRLGKYLCTYDDQRYLIISGLINELPLDSVTLKTKKLNKKQPWLNAMQCPALNPRAGKKH